MYFNFNDFSFLLDISMKINLHVWFYLRDWSHGVERFALSECILLCYGLPLTTPIHVFYNTFNRCHFHHDTPHMLWGSLSCKNLFIDLQVLPHGL